MFLEKLADIMRSQKISGREYELRDKNGRILAGDSNVGFLLYFKGGKWFVDFVETDRGVLTYRYDCPTEKEACKTFLEKSDWAFGLSNFAEQF